MTNVLFLANDLNSVIDLTFNLSSTDKHYPYEALPGPKSGDIYYMANVSPEPVDNQMTYFARLLDKNNPLWFRVYKYRASKEDYDISQDEKFIYTCAGSLSLTLMQLDAENGDLLQAKYVKGLKGQMLSSTRVAPDGVTVYTGVQNKATFFGEICRWDSTKGTDVKCRAYGNYTIPAIITPIDSNNVFTAFQNYTFEFLGVDTVYMTKMNFQSTADTWCSTLLCNYDRCSASRGGGVLHEEKNLLYNLINYRYDVLFYSIDVETGLAQSKYMWSDYDQCGTIRRLQMFGDMIYLAYSCKGYLAYVAYNTTEDRFISSYFGDNAFDVLTFSPTRLFFAYSFDEPFAPNEGLNAPDAAYIKRGPVTSVNSLYNIAVDTNQMVIPKPDKKYKIRLNETLLDYEIVSWTVTDPDPIEEETTTKVNTIFNKTSDVEFYLEPITVPTLLNNGGYTVPINVTCSKSGNTKISYSKGNYTEVITPDWVNIDQENSVLKLNPPYVNEASNYTFAFNITVENQNERKVYQKVISTAVKPCQVDNCEHCSQNGAEEVCHQCICK